MTCFASVNYQKMASEKAKRGVFYLSQGFNLFRTKQEIKQGKRRTRTASMKAWVEDDHRFSSSDEARWGFHGNPERRGRCKALGSRPTSILDVSSELRAMKCP